MSESQSRVAVRRRQSRARRLTFEQHELAELERLLPIDAIPELLDLCDTEAASLFMSKTKPTIAGVRKRFEKIAAQASRFRDELEPLADAWHAAHIATAANNLTGDINAYDKLIGRLVQDLEALEAISDERARSLAGATKPRRAPSTYLRMLAAFCELYGVHQAVNADTPFMRIAKIAAQAIGRAAGVPLSTDHVARSLGKKRLRVG